MADILELKNGSHTAFVRLYKAFSPKLYNFICTVIKSRVEAKDILQNVFLKVWEKREELEPDKNFESYIFIIARNLCISHLRTEFYAQLTSLESCTKSHDEVMQGVIVKDSVNFIQEIIDQLPERRREIFILSRVSGMTYKQIANHLDISENTVDTQIRRALSFLKKKLDKEQMLLLLMVFI